MQQLWLERNRAGHANTVEMTEQQCLKSWQQVVCHLSFHPQNLGPANTTKMDLPFPYPPVHEPV